MVSYKKTDSEKREVLWMNFIKKSFEWLKPYGFLSFITPLYWLKLNIVSVWGINNFDIILGNPPYNKGGIRSHTGKQLGDKNETIWTKFIEKSFNLLKPNRFLVFINPLSWLKKSHSLHNIMLEKHIVLLKLWDNS